MASGGKRRTAREMDNAKKFAALQQKLYGAQIAGRRLEKDVSALNKAAALHQQRSKAATEWAQQTKTRSMAVRPTAALHPQRSRFI